MLWVSGEFPPGNLSGWEQGVYFTVAVQFPKLFEKNGSFENSGIRVTTVRICSLQWLCGVCRTSSQFPSVPGRSREHEVGFKIAKMPQSHILSVEPRRKWGHFRMTETSAIHKTFSHSSVEPTQTKFGGNNFCHWIYNFLASLSLFCCPIRNSNQMSWQVLSMRTTSHALSLLGPCSPLPLLLPPGCMQENLP